MNTDRCVLYLNSSNPMTRLNSMDVDGKTRVPVTLPYLKCLEDVVDDLGQKYRPYKHVEVFVREKPLEVSNALTIRQRRAYEMRKQGFPVSEIAKSMRASNNSVRAMISVAKAKIEGKN